MPHGDWPINVTFHHAAQNKVQALLSFSLFIPLFLPLLPPPPLSFFPFFSSSRQCLTMYLTGLKLIKFSVSNSWVLEERHLLFWFCHLMCPRLTSNWRSRWKWHGTPRVPVSTALVLGWQEPSTMLDFLCSRTGAGKLAQCDRSVRTWLRSPASIRTLEWRCVSETPVLEGWDRRVRERGRERGERESETDRLNKKGALENGSVLKLGQIQESKAFVLRQVFAMCPWPNYSPKPPNHIQCAI